MLSVLEWVIITVCVVGLGVVVYVQLGFPVLWGPYRGVPFCGHPFEQTWLLEPSEQHEGWTCPKCGTRFKPVGGKWMPVR
jgi:hypothetical protein